MSKTETAPTLVEAAQEIAKQLGLVLMAAAATAGLVDLPNQHERRAILAAQPVYAFAGNHQNGEDNTLRRERDDLAPHYVSYTTYQRTPSRSGRH